MENQKKLIEEGNWKYLIILDACRYDYFNELYRSYFEGHLKKVKSPASCTPEFLKKTFQGFYKDTLYVSANPHANSTGSFGIEKWKATEHFPKVIDVWDFGWDKELGTVPPKTMSNNLLKIAKKGQERKIIAHYIQPHAPYLSLPNQQMIAGVIKKKKGSKFSLILKRKIGKKILHCMGMDKVFKVRQFFGLEPKFKGEKLWRDLSKRDWVEAYKKDLRKTLKEIKKIVPKLDGEVVITSDHGESLGDDGLYMHPIHMDVPVLREVPWFKVDKK